MRGALIPAVMTSSVQAESWGGSGFEGRGAEWDGVNKALVYTDAGLTLDNAGLQYNEGAESFVCAFLADI